MIMMIVKSEIGVLYFRLHIDGKKSSMRTYYSCVQLGSSAELTENNLNNKKHRK